MLTTIKARRNITWFNPPFSNNVATNIGKEFFSLLAKHFPPSNRLHKIINKQNVKLSYSCLPNMRGIIANHNKRVLNKATSEEKRALPCIADIRQTAHSMVDVAKNPSFTRHQLIYQTARQ